jgi:tetratricopeptide (TPR) repeat protein/CHAT domain-containing protein
MNNKIFHSETKLGLIVLSIFGTIAVSLPLGLTVNPVFAQNNVSINEAKKFQAEQLFNEGDQLFKQGTKESLEQAIIKFKQALILYQELGNKSREAKTLTSLGEIYYSLGNQKNALNYLEQSLTLSRSVGDRTLEATALNNIGAVYKDLGDKQKALDYLQQSLSLSRSLGNPTEEATALNNIGAVYKDLGDKQKALDYYQQSLSLRKAVVDQAGEAITLKNISDLYKELGEKKKALEYYQQALPLFKTVGDSTGEAAALNNIGSLYNDLGEKQKALDYYQKSLSLSQTIGHRIGEAITLNNIGDVYKDLGQKQKALDYYQKSLPLTKSLGDRTGEAATLNNIGNAYDDLGEKQKALDYYNQSLLISKDIGDLLQQATNLNDIGTVYNALGEIYKALDYLNQALIISRKIGDNRGEVNTLSNIGFSYDVLEKKQKALEYLQQALQLSRAMGNHQQEAVTLNNIGKVYYDLGETQKALDYYKQSLLILEKLGYGFKKANTLNNIGIVYNALGDKEKALEYYQQSLQLSKAVGDRFGEVTSLNNIGTVYDDLGEKQKALDFYKQSLLISKEVGNRPGEATAINNIGYIYNALGDKQKALDYFKQALLITRKLGDRSGEATNLNNIAGIYDSLGEKQKALDYVNQALLIEREIGNAFGEAKSLYNIAYTEKTRGNLQASLKSMQVSIAIVEDLRLKIVSPDLRISYFSTVQEYYKFYIEILMQLHKQNPKSGYNITAFEISERSRSRGLIDLLNESKADIKKGVDPNLKQKEQQLSQRISGKTQYQLQFTQQLINQGLPEKEIPTKLEPIKKEINELQTQLQQIQAEIRTKNPRYAALTQPQPVSLKSIQQQLDNDSVLLEYSLGDKNSYLWLITATSISSYELPKGSEIETISNEYLTTITKQDTGINKTRAKAAIKLSKILLAPVAEAIKNKRLIIVSDGNLQYIPFNFLAVPNAILSAAEQEILKTFKPLLVDHEIINLPSASTLEFIREFNKENPILPKTLAVIADPVFSPTDERVNNKYPQPKKPENSQLSSLKLEKLTRSFSTRDGELKLTRLPGTRKEAENILTLIPENQTKKAFDFDANLTTINSSELSQYRFLHIATHGFLNSINPELSGIVLSLINNQGQEQTGLLLTPDIFNLNLPADLIVLSACDTAWGKDVKGEGIVGLTRGFMYAGTPRLMLSLWKVNDYETSELMSRFYKIMLQEKLTPSQSLRKAQLSMWKEGKAPYFWSAFILQGEWR